MHIRPCLVSLNLGKVPSLLMHTLRVIESPPHLLPRWFHPTLNGPEAEELLMQEGKIGSFLIRPSRSSPGHYALSIRFVCKCRSVIVVCLALYPKSHHTLSLNVLSRSKDLCVLVRSTLLQFIF